MNDICERCGTQTGPEMYVETDSGKVLFFCSTECREIYEKEVSGR